jgi:DNA-binding transcriptional ArsR family regulator
LTYISNGRHDRPVHAFDVLGDPVRRRILEMLADGELTSGAITAVIQREFGISQPAVSQHLRVLRENGFATVRPEGSRRLYAVDSTPLHDVDVWLDRFRRFWNQRLDALDTELARGRRDRRRRGGPSAPPAPSPSDRSPSGPAPSGPSLSGQSPSPDRPPGPAGNDNTEGEAR